MKIELLDLQFNSEKIYVEKESIVEKVIFNNRTFYSKFEEYKTPISSILLEQHSNNEISLAIPLVENNTVNYIVIEYQKDDWNSFHSLLKHLLKSLNIDSFQAYINIHKNLFQLFIPKDNLNLEEAYTLVENIQHLLEIKSKQNYKIYPNKNLPKNFNIISLPTQKI